MAVRLSNATLTSLPADVVIPRYDRARLTPGIVHIGLGNFHRAHQAWYLHRLMQEGLAFDWAIVGAGVRDYDRTQRRKLADQDCLTTLIQLDAEGISAEVIGSIIDYVPIESGNRPLIARMADPAIRIVGLTVTEAGYFVDEATGRFAENDPEICHDIEYPDTPRTAFGAIVAALRLRRDAGHRPFTLQSSDNLLNNGAVLRQTVVSLARRADPDLADWIAASCAFPNSMVDRIVPVTGVRERALAASLGIGDLAPVTHETYCQWVIEDNFCAGRPDWERVGATLTSDVRSHEMMKIRILNAGHQIIAAPGELLGAATIADCMASPAIRSFFRKVAAAEIAPHLRPVPGMTPQSYIDLIDARFANRNIIDTTRRVAASGMTRHAGFVHPILRDALAGDMPFAGLTLAEACWARMCAGSREDGTAIEPNDPHWSELNTVANAARANPLLWLKQQHIYGPLASHPGFSACFAQWLQMIWNHGTGFALEAYINSAA
ncbi:MAG: mannitol dehydrogenase family protein [Rhodobacteraceae bacterium]|nr:mannitol dehydrogenase family protein [Paracoccaceae bacterium]